MNLLLNSILPTNMTNGRQIKNAIIFEQNKSTSEKLKPNYCSDHISLVSFEQFTS